MTKYTWAKDVNENNSLQNAETGEIVVALVRATPGVHVEWYVNKTEWAGAPYVGNVYASTAAAMAAVDKYFAALCAIGYTVGGE